MKDNEEEKNTTQQEPNQEGINSNKSIEIPPLNKSSEKNKGEIQEKSEDNEKINTNEKNNSKKSLTEKENRNGENKEKETDNVNIISKEKNINNINNENEEDITNIKYVSQNQFDKLKKEQIQKELNSKNAIHTIEDLQQNPNKKFTINSPRSLKALFDSGFSLDQLYYKTFEEFIDENTLTFSFKLIFMLGMLKLADRGGEVRMDKLVEEYKAFYMERIEHGLPVDRSNCIYDRDYLNDNDKLKRSILSNPFEKFERKRFIYYSKDLSMLSFNPALWRQMTEEKKEEIRVKEKDFLKAYYEKLGGLVEQS